MHTGYYAFTVNFYSRITNISLVIPRPTIGKCKKTGVVHIYIHNVKIVKKRKLFPGEENLNLKFALSLPNMTDISNKQVYCRIGKILIGSRRQIYPS